MRNTLLLALLWPAMLNAQFDLTFDQSIPVTRDGSNLPMAWAGGLNFPQLSDIDLDGDGRKDLFFFDRSGNSVVTLINDGVPGQSSYHYTKAFNDVYPFPELTEWVLLRDYNCDGKEDIFGYTLGGFKVYKNISSGGNLAFVEVDTLVHSNYVPDDANLYVTQVDIPGIEDIDGDGDLDVITYSIFGNYVEYHKNMSMELYGTCDSLKYEVANRCWGFFTQSLTSTHNTLNNPCQFNVPDPEVTTQIERSTAQLQADPHHLLDAGERAHSGSTSLPIDLDGDGDKDYLTGGVQFNNLIGMTNGGLVDSAYMVAQDTLFPSYDQSALVDIFPAAFYEDVDNDARRDLVVMPNYPSLSENYHSVWFYHNNGTDAAPTFHFTQNNLFQDRMIDVGEGAYPVTFDYNGDGLMDLVVANYGYYQSGGTYPGKLALFENTGTASQPAFTLVTDDYMNLSTSGIGAGMYPAFGDMDGDGDKDMYIGNLQGKIYAYNNIATGPVADFTLADSPLVVYDTTRILDVGQYATPQFFDVDGDGKLDMLIGERNGNINYYHNTGDTIPYKWHLANDSIGGVVVAEWWNITGYSVPFMYLNDLGQRELLVGSESGAIYQYDNIDGNLNGTWNQVDSTWEDLHEGARTALTLYDFNNDGHRDAVIGNYRGGLSFWRNDIGSSTNEHTMLSGEQAFLLMPNPTTDGTDLLLNMPVGKDLRVNVLNELGQVAFASSVQDKRFHLDTRALAQGVYTVRLSSGERRWTQRLVVLH